MFLIDRDVIGEFHDGMTSDIICYRAKKDDFIGICPQKLQKLKSVFQRIGDAVMPAQSLYRLLAELVEYLMEMNPVASFEVRCSSKMFMSCFYVVVQCVRIFIDHWKSPFRNTGDGSRGSTPK